MNKNLILTGMMGVGKSTIGNAFGIASQFGINIGNTSNASYVYPEIIRSKVVVRNLLKKKVDSETYGKNRSLISIITGQNLDVFDAKMEIIATNKLLKNSIVGFKKFSGRSALNGKISVWHKGSGCKSNFRKINYT